MSPHELAAATIVEPPGDSQLLVQDAGRSDGVRVVNLAFDVYRFDLPLLGDRRHSLKLWNHVDELRNDPDRIAVLARSGLRMGVFSDDAWRPLRVILNAAEARRHRERVQAQVGLPLVLEVGKVDGYESIFSFSGGGRLTGKTFEDGKKLVSVGYALYGDTAGRMDIEVSLEIRHDRGEMTWERVGGSLRQVPVYDRHVFAELTTVMTLNPGESLLIGPSAEADNANLVGGSFLGKTRDGKAFETLIVVTPVPYESSGVAAG